MRIRPRPATRRLLVAVVAIAAACTAPREACLDRAAAELVTLDAEIAEIERALARGYRAENRSALTAGLTLCARDSPVALCVSGERPLRERVTAIDPVTERARLRDRQARRPAVAAAAADAAAACPSG